MPKKIIIVRHGETDFNVQKILQGHLDTYLTKNGLRQANEVAIKLADEKIDIIFSSDSKRAYHTALMIGSYFSKKIIITELLRERFFGKLEGLTFTEIRKVLWCFGIENDEMDRLIKERSKTYGVETNEELRMRLLKLFKQIKKYKNKTVVLVTHGGTMRELAKIFGHRITGKIINTECLYFEKNSEGNYLFLFPTFNPA